MNFQVFESAVACFIKRARIQPATVKRETLQESVVSTRSTRLDVEWIAADTADTVEPEAIAQVILLHGWGANARDLMPLATELHLPGCIFGFPNAPLPHPQIPTGRAWYDLDTQTGLAESAEMLQTWLEGIPQQTGVPLAKTVLGGFSQGGAMTLRVGLTLPLAGLVCLSGYLASAPARDRLFSPAPSVWMTHGRQDPVIPIEIARQSRTAVEAMGATVQYREYEMGHQLIPAEIADVRTFLSSLRSV